MKSYNIITKALGLLIALTMQTALFAQENKVNDAIGRKQVIYNDSHEVACIIEENGVVYDGRDTGTVVCPNADLKFYITAPVEVRAQRRCNDLIKAGFATDYEAVLAEMKARDDRDMNRASAPLTKPIGAVEFDTSLHDTAQNLADIAAIIDKKFDL